MLYDFSRYSSDKNPRYLSYAIVATVNRTLAVPQVVVIFSSSSVRISDPDKVLKEHIIPGSATLSGCDKAKAFCSRYGCTLFIVPMK